MMSEMHIFDGAIARHKATLDRFLADGAYAEAQKAAGHIVEAFRTGHTVFICGNGGSAADAQHLATEWICKYKRERAPLPSIALTTNTSALTAIGNDFGFEFAFSRQVEALGREKDVLIALSTSGSSANIVEAARTARAKKMFVIALTGERGFLDASLCDSVIAVPSSETARIQEMHELIYHMWCEYVDANL